MDNAKIFEPSFKEELMQTILAIVYFGSILVLFTKLGKEQAQEALSYYPKLTLVLPFVLFFDYACYTQIMGGIDHKLLPWVLIFFLLPCLILWAGRRAENKPNWEDLTALICLWVPFDAHWLDKRPNHSPGSQDWTLIALSIILIGMAFWFCLRKLKGTKINLELTLADLAKTAWVFVVAGTILTLLGIYTGFLAPRDFWRTELEHSSIPQVAWRHLATTKFFELLRNVFVTIALSEEFYFRAIGQNLLNKALGNKTASWLLASAAFGATHLYKHPTGVSFQHMNWGYAGMATVAGLAYGLTFNLTKSVFWAMLIHALVDAIWHTLFK